MVQWNFHAPPNTKESSLKINAVKRLQEFYSEFPNKSDKETMELLNMPQATFYRAKAKLKELDEEIKQTIAFQLPTGVRQKILPPQTYKNTHLAAYLSKFRMGDKVPPFGETKAEIMFKIKRMVENDPALASELVFTLQDRLALFALWSGDVSAFSGSVGQLHVPEKFWTDSPVRKTKAGDHGE